MDQNSPHLLQLDAPWTLDKTFKHWPGGIRWKCSCGHRFKGSDNACPRAKEGQVHDVTEIDPQQQFSMRLRHFGAMEALGIQGFVNEMGVKYLGIGEEGTPGYVKPTILPPVGGQPVRMSLQSCAVAGILFKAQFPVEGQDPLPFETLCMWMASDTMCDQMSEASVEIQIGENPSPLA